MLKVLAAALLAASASAAPRPSTGDAGGLVAARARPGVAFGGARPGVAFGGAKPPLDLPAESLTFAPLDLAKRAAVPAGPKPYVPTSLDAGWVTVPERAEWGMAVAADDRRAVTDERRAAAMLAVAAAEAEAAGVLPPPGAVLGPQRAELAAGHCPRRLDDGYPYPDVLRLAVDFYHAQRLGPLPANDTYARPWRASSMLGDPFPAHADAGDHLVLMFPYGQTLALLGWAFLPENFRAGFDASPGAVDSLRATLRWGASAVMAAHAGGPRRYIVQVGDEHVDHAAWTRPEDVRRGNGLPRPVLELDGDAGKNGSDAAGEGVAALAAAALAWRGVDDEFAAAAAAAAESLYAFATECEGYFSQAVPVGDMYPSSSYLDDLVWASAWMARLTGNATYLARASAYFDRLAGEEPRALLSREQSWSVTTPAAAAMLAGLTDDPKYAAFAFLVVETHVQGAEPVSYTPAGLAYRIKWGSARNAANPALVAAVFGRLLRSWAAGAGAGAANATDAAPPGPPPPATRRRTRRPPPPPPSPADRLGRMYLCWARGQVRYILGDAGRSFVVGWGTNPPTHVHHRAASCRTEVGAPGSGDPPCDDRDFASPHPNPQVHAGALAGGPDALDRYNDTRSDYVRNEVALDYNAAFAGVLAMLSMETGDTWADCLRDFPEDLRPILKVF